MLGGAHSADSEHDINYLKRDNFADAHHVNTGILKSDITGAS